MSIHFKHYTIDLLAWVDYFVDSMLDLQIFSNNILKFSLRRNFWQKSISTEEMGNLAIILKYKLVQDVKGGSYLSFYNIPQICSITNFCNVHYFCKGMWRYFECLDRVHLFLGYSFVLSLPKTMEFLATTAFKYQPNLEWWMQMLTMFEDYFEQLLRWMLIFLITKLWAHLWGLGC